MRSKTAATLLAASITAVTLIAMSAAPARAAPVVVLAAAASLNEVITNITVWIGGLLGGLATLLLTVGGVRYLLANSDPAEIMKAKETLKYAAIGYGVAILAPVLLTVLNGFVK